MKNNLIFQKKNHWNFLHKIWLPNLNCEIGEFEMSLTFLAFDNQIDQKGHWTWLQPKFIERTVSQELCQ